MFDTIEPTAERLSKNTFDRPEVDNKRNARAYVSRDQLWELLRTNSIAMPEFQAGEKFRRHCYGVLGHDVRIQDATSDKVDNDGMPQFQLHGLALAKVRDILTQREYLSLELLLLHDLPPSQIGLQISKYKTREQSKPFALAIIQTALDRLSELWGLKIGT